MFIKSIFGKNKKEDAIQNVNKQLSEINKTTTDLLRKNDEIMMKLDIMQQMAERKLNSMTSR